ncbi:hypothetical protein FE257_000939 [Aspergillus nanangensis]|uniref:Aminotransferase class I/classII large domain-containing protein n=1 Tax=Aspergillus nanangensis TaxID=2582783 RepID=A0AAD4CEJ9_ASPNN|nr:hypothetical protein FE257_000939 [Aspergillus nanangensis]
MQSTISARGEAFAEKKPVFFDVLSNLWDPESNPNGIVNIGLAENSLLHPELVKFINAEVLETTSFRSLVNVLDFSFGSVDPFSLEGVQLYEQAYQRAIEDGKSVKAILLCSPSNPLGRFILPIYVNYGRCYPRGVLESYMKLCNRRRLHLISDEIYGLSVWDNPALDDNVGFTSVLSIDAAQFMNPSMVHVVWGLSKAIGFWCDGLANRMLDQPKQCCIFDLRRGNILRPPVVISQNVTANHSHRLFNFPSSLADKCATALLMDDEVVDHLVSLNQSRLKESYDHVTQLLRDHGIPFKESNACLFVWVNLAAVVKDDQLSDDDILARLRAEMVYVTSGSTYASEERGWFRLVIAHPRHVLDEGVRRIASAIL